MTINALNYFCGGLVCPAGYHKPTIPYGPPVATVNAAIWFVLGPVVLANFDTRQFALRKNNADGSYTGFVFEFYVNPTPPPIAPIVGIDLTGLTTVTQVAAATLAAMASVGFVTQAGLIAGTFRVTQPFPGNQGDIGFLQPIDGLFSITPPGSASGDAVFDLYGQTVFFAPWNGAGYELSLPGRIGQRFAMLPASPGVLFNAEPP